MIGRICRPGWVGDYHHIPYVPHGRDATGLDCWGLVRLIYKERFEIDLPDLADRYAGTENKDGAALAAVVAEVKQDWREIGKGRERLGDVIVLRCAGEPMHVGLIVGDGMMLHTQRRSGVSLEVWDGIKWRNRVVGFYRHAKM